MKDCLVLYLTMDGLQLACVFEEFPELIYKTYGLDCSYYVSISNFSRDAFKRTSSDRVQLLSEREHLELAERLIRGGLSSIYSKRLFTSNNPQLDNFDVNKPTTYCLQLDANNLYGGVMYSYNLPLSNYSLV